MPVNVTLSLNQAKALHKASTHSYWNYEYPGAKLDTLTKSEVNSLRQAIEKLGQAIRHSPDTSA